MKTRRPEIDMAKALGMLAVLWGHLMTEGQTNYLVYAFHIPMFFFLSGLMFRPGRYDLKTFLGRRVHSLLLPYLAFSAVTWLWWVVRNTLLGNGISGGLRFLAQTFIAQGSWGFLNHNVALWFVSCLFVTELLYFFMSKLPRAATFALCILCAGLGWLLRMPNTFFDFTKLPWSLEVSMTCMVFYGAGSLLSDREEALRDWVRDHKAPAAILAAVLTVILWFGSGCNGHVSVAQNRLGENDLLFYALAFCGIASTLLTAVLLTSRPCRALEPLLYLGKNSFYAMAIHVPVMLDLLWLASKLTGMESDAMREDLRYTLPIFAAMTLITYLWIRLLRSDRIRQILTKITKH